MKVFPFPFLSLLNKITEGQLDALTCAKSLKLQGVILEDVVWIFDEMLAGKFPIGQLLPGQLPLEKCFQGSCPTDNYHLEQLSY